MRTVFFGSGRFALPALRRLLALPEVAVVLVVSAPPRPVGRRAVLTATPVGELAAERGLSLLTPVSLRDPAVVDELRGANAGLIVLADYGRLVPPAVLALPAHGALNLHPSLLPRHRGATPVPAAILAGDERTGVTLMRMDAGLDSGPIVAQAAVPLDGTEMAPDLEERLAERGADLLVEHLPAWLAGTIEATPQADAGMTMTRPLRRADGLLDPARSAGELQRQVRAYQPWPGSFIEQEGQRLIVWRASIVPGDGATAPGDLVPMGDGLALATAAGLLRLDEVQPAGGRRMTGAEYRRGRRP